MNSSESFHLHNQSNAQPRELFSSHIFFFFFFLSRFSTLCFPPQMRQFSCTLMQFKRFILFSSLQRWNKKKKIFLSSYLFIWRHKRAEKRKNRRILQLSELIYGFGRSRVLSCRYLGSEEKDQTKHFCWCLVVHRQGLKIILEAWAFFRWETPTTCAFSNADGESRLKTKEQKNLLTFWFLKLIFFPNRISAINYMTTMWSVIIDVKISFSNTTPDGEKNLDRWKVERKSQ